MADPPRDECTGNLQIFIADESSCRCTLCGWIGWPRQDIEIGTGRTLRVYPHPRFVPPVMKNPQ